MAGKVIIIMGSGSDQPFVDSIASALRDLGINFERRVASAHKTPKKLLAILEENENHCSIVYVTVAGMSNALSGFVDANTVHPVIACPPVAAGFESIDVFSSLRMPKGVSPLVVLQPENAAAAAAKILAATDSDLRGRIEAYQAELRKRVEKDDEKVKS
jgi:5-(carboxyamino)imidazole ribonucleotide mutase